MNPKFTNHTPDQSKPEQSQLGLARKTGIVRPPDSASLHRPTTATPPSLEALAEFAHNSRSPKMGDSVETKVLGLFSAERGWEEIHGPSSGTGAEYWFRNEALGKDAYVCIDQGELQACQITATD